MTKGAGLTSNSENLTWVFGYLYIEKDGAETIWARAYPSNQWGFTIAKKFDASRYGVQEVIDSEIAHLYAAPEAGARQQALCHGLEPPKVVKIPLEISKKNQAANSQVTPWGFFFKIRLDAQWQKENDHFTWRAKSELWQSPESCCDRHLLSPTNQDCIYEQYGFRVLDCVDIVVFRGRASQPEFLMLKRNVPESGTFVWEYPKGGMFYHETAREAAVRELYEETNSASYLYRADLGSQIVDVSQRKRKYDTLRVHGLTFKFVGSENEIQPAMQEGFHSTFEWMPFEQAQDSVWMRNYGPEFFNRWKRNASAMF